LCINATFGIDEVLYHHPIFKMCIELHMMCTYDLL
jgi:hypothetical protein